MDWYYKAILTAITVAAVLMMAQSLGRRVAGIFSGLPIISAPVLLWVALDQGVVFAAHAALGVVAACGLMVLFCLTYERVARRTNAFFTIIVSLVTMWVAALIVAAFDASLATVFVAAIAACMAATRLIPNPSSVSSKSHCRRSVIVLTALVAGAMSAVIGAHAREVGPLWAGLIASLPIISVCVLIHQQITATHHDVQRFLHGYLMGLVGKACFAAAFSMLVLRDELWIAFVGAALAAFFVLTVAERVRALAFARRQQDSSSALVVGAICRNHSTALGMTNAREL